MQKASSWNDAEILGMEVAGITTLKFTSKSGEKGFQSADVAGAK